MLKRVRISTKRALITVVIREQLSEIIAWSRDLIHFLVTMKKTKKTPSNLSFQFSRYAHRNPSQKSKLVLLDHFPIYRWAIPNFLLAHRIAEETNAKVAVFTFRHLNQSAKLLYRQLFVDEQIIIKLNLNQKLLLIKEYRRFVKFLEGDQSLIEYRINDISVGLDIYESILRTGRPTVNLNEIQTYRIAYLGIKQYIFFKGLFEQEKVQSVLVSHDNYIGPGLLAHMAFHFEVEVIIANLLSMAMPVREFQLYEKFGRYQMYIDHIDENTLVDGIAWAKDQLSKRIMGNLGIGINYQIKSAFDSTTIDRQSSENSGTKVLIVTHDFFDNPHGYARMTFDDFYAWMEFLLNVSHETDYEWYVKPHRDYSEIELAVLTKFCASNPNFRMISSETSFHQIKSEGIDFVLTCFGTVGHELPLLGFTVINASYNPHSAFNFNINIKSQDEYVKILKNISNYRLSLEDYSDIYKFYFVHYQIVQNDMFMGVSMDILDSFSKDTTNSNLELEYLLINIDRIAECAFFHLDSMRVSRRIYAFEDFLPVEKQLRHSATSTPSEISN